MRRERIDTVPNSFDMVMAVILDLVGPPFQAVREDAGFVQSLRHDHIDQALLRLVEAFLAIPSPIVCGACLAEDARVGAFAAVGHLDQLKLPAAALRCARGSSCRRSQGSSDSDAKA